MTEIFTTLVGEIVKASKATDLTGEQKKQMALAGLKELFGDEDDWAETEAWMSPLIDFLVAVGKHKVAFDLLNKRKFFKCCGV